MRGDRLVALLMLLQARRRMTARALAAELEVSERTIYRDMDALSAAGVPVVAERGPQGGCALLDGYRTDLTGMTEGEIQALFLAGGAGPLADLGWQDAGKAARLKLAAALPAARRAGLEQMRLRLHLDTTGWDEPDEPVPCLPAVQEALLHDRRLGFAYRRSDGRAVKRHVEPYGLVAKGTVWYLVAGLVQQAPAYGVARVQAARKAIHVYRVSRMAGARVTDETFTRPEQIDLPAYWTAWCADFAAQLPHYPITLRCAPGALPLLPRVVGEGVRRQIEAAGPPDASGRITLALTFPSFEVACGQILALGADVEVVDPPDLRAALRDLAARVLALYRDAPEAGRRDSSLRSE